MNLHVVTPLTFNPFVSPTEDLVAVAVADSQQEAVMADHNTQSAPDLRSAPPKSPEWEKKVLDAAGNQCEWVTNGNRCGGKTNLRAKAYGSDGSALCPSHWNASE